MAYVLEEKRRPKLLYLPLGVVLKKRDGTQRAAEIGYIQPDEQEQVRAILNYEIEQGNTYPQDKVLTPEGFKAYYLSYDCFVLRDTTQKKVLGSFYIKPQLPWTVQPYLQRRIPCRER